MLTIAIDPDVEQQLEAAGVTTEAGKVAWVEDAVRRRLARAGLERRKAELAQRVDDFVARAFEGEPIELTDERWDELLAGKRRSPFQPDSLAVPPGWKRSGVGPGDTDGS